LPQSNNKCISPHLKNVSTLYCESEYSVFVEIILQKKIWTEQILHICANDCWGFTKVVILWL